MEREREKRKLPKKRDVTIENGNHKTQEQSRMRRQIHLKNVILMHR